MGLPLLPRPAWPRFIAPAQLIVLGSLPCAVLAGWAAAHGHGPELIAAVPLVAVAAWLLTTPYGSAAAAAPLLALPVRVMPGAPTIPHLDPKLTWALVAAGATFVFWFYGARQRRLSPWTAAALAVVGAAVFLLGEAHGARKQDSLYIIITAATGLALGSTLLDEKARRGLVLLGAGLALVAIGEAVGLPNPWVTVLGANRYVDLSNVQGATRAASSFGHPLIAGACLMMLGMFALTLRGKGAAVLTVVLLIGAAATVSRSALIGGAVGLIAYAGLSRTGERGRALVVIAGVAVVAVVVLGSVPSVRSSFSERVGEANSAQQVVRINTINIVEGDWSGDPGRLLVGQGIGSGGRYLVARGGNAAGFSIFDNQYVTSLYDAGLLVLVAFAVLVVLGIVEGTSLGRLGGLPALAVGLVVLAFVDGLYWPPLVLLLWAAIGLASIPAIVDDDRG
jgi:hypothetical protein